MAPSTRSTDIRLSSYGEHPFWARYTLNLSSLLGEDRYRDVAVWDDEATDTWDRPRVFADSHGDIFSSATGMTNTRNRLWETVVRFPRLDWVIFTRQPRSVGGSTPNEWDVAPVNHGIMRTRFPRNLHVGTRLFADRSADGLVAAQELQRLTVGSTLLLDVEPGADLKQVERLVADRRVRVLCDLGGRAGTLWADDLIRVCTQHQTLLVTS